ncbi:MAG: NAD(P)-dependent glycerol-3-phosphate dehydrogenase [Betaproteobacteria bacterium]|nr:NAD(P)-dependent glycerol-3-phosphate dehydrogenase [Betaproteobacteria bacterium]MDE2047229.1 NAD(P)-dependent glycerol-3-phosphate dehydrogenase [Betaproteobacteria bacterium]
MKIAVLGAGAWGTALAAHAARNTQQHVTLWARDPVLIDTLRSTQKNSVYLPWEALPNSLQYEADLRAAVHGAQLLVAAAPVAGLRPLLQAVAALSTAPVLWLCKGFEAGTRALPHQVVQHMLPDSEWAALSGPSFAQEVARGLPVALTAAGPHAALNARVQQALHHGAMRVYTTDDVIGVEVGGAVKNVMAIATGVADGLQLGMNARAALVTRGLAEMTRLALALGGRAETLTGLTGLGDLVLTCTGDLSRNRKVGLLLAQGRSPSDAVASLGHVAEGVQCAQATQALARERGVSMPITDTVCELLAGRLPPQAAVRALLEREARAEF